MGITMYYPLFLQGVQGVSATVSGQVITPYSVLTAFIGVPAGFLLARTKRCRSMYVAGYGVLAVSMFGMAALQERTPLWFGVLVTSFAGLGLGSIPTINTLVAQFSVPKRLLGVAVGAMFFFVITGRAIAPAVLGSAMNSTYAKTLQRSLPPELKELSGSDAFASLTDMRVLLSIEARNNLRKACDSYGVRGTAIFDQTIKAIREALEAGLRKIFIIGVITMLVSFLLILTIPEVSMDVEALDKRPPVRI
jgi:MFS family permease